jgi:soluble lytic murein transglycosylase
MTSLLTAVRSCLLISILWGVSIEAGEIERQRELFRNVYAEVELGNWGVIDSLADDEQQLLRDYILWPDLRATWLRANMAAVPDAEIDAFVAQFGTLKPARELRYRHALNFVKNGDLAGYLKIYEQFYQGQEIAKLDCLALQAEIEAGRHQRVEIRALDLWLVGKSQVSECDPVFDYLDERNLLGLVEYQKRFELAIEARNFSLAKWLARNIDQKHIDDASNWHLAQTSPDDFLQRSWKKSGDATLREQLVYAAERLTYRDPNSAHDLWARVSKKYQFSAAQKLRTARHIALWTARDNLPHAYKRLLQLPAAAVNEEVLRWRARTSLREARWKRLLTDIAAMPDAEKNSEEWRYWRAIAQIESGQAFAAIADLESLRQERSFYGFLAADKLDKDYALDHSDLMVNEAKLAELEARPEILRARELFFVGQDSRGRSEWDAAMRQLSGDEKSQAAILADRWGWHSRAIAAVASTGEYNDLSIRYPLPYKESFELFSTAASIPSTWAYGIARSESLFMRDVRSSAGAIGLMQLMPATGRDVARDIKLPYQGLTTLVDPESNIRLGTSYLGQMAARYGGNQVLATAAYNAGPHRVDGWLPQNGSLDARIWIENIPFNETRKYVKRVLAAQTIFHWRMTGQVRRLSDELSLIKAAPVSPQVASR